MALGAVHPQVSARQREIGFPVVENIVRSPGRMTSQARRVAVSIAIHTSVVVIRFRVGMAGNTRKLRVI